MINRKTVNLATSRLSWLLLAIGYTVMLLEFVARSIPVVEKTAPPVASLPAQDPATVGTCCVQCDSPADACCLPCADQNSHLEHETLMAMTEAHSMFLETLYKDKVDLLKDRTWTGNSHVGHRPLQASFYYDLARSLKPSVVCEIGFNGGHSASVFLAATPASTVMKSFDFYGFLYSEPGADFVRRLFPGRLETIRGDSAVTVPNFARRHGRVCDLFSIDGDHSYEGAKKDIINAAKATRAGGTVLLDDMTRGVGTRRAFDEVVATGMIQNPRCLEKKLHLISRINRYDTSDVRKLSLSYCFATVS